MIDHLPQNPEMLVSVINRLLRDGEFESLEDLCSYYDRTEEELRQLLQDGRNHEMHKSREHENRIPASTTYDITAPRSTEEIHPSREAEEITPIEESSLRIEDGEKDS